MVAPRRRGFDPRLAHPVMLSNGVITSFTNRYQYYQSQADRAVPGVVHFSMNPVILSTRFRTSRRSRPLSVLPFPAHMEYAAAAALPPATRTCGGASVGKPSVACSSSNMACSDAQGRHRRFRREIISTGSDGAGGGETSLEGTIRLVASPSSTTPMFLSCCCSPSPEPGHRMSASWSSSMASPSGAGRGEPGVHGRRHI
jgi:hypothetical protein